MGLLADLEAAMAVIEAAVADLEPECLAAGDAVALVEVFARGERVCTAGRALAGRRVARSSAWRPSGERSAAHWMARQAGTSVGEAVNVLQTAERVESLPAVDHAFRSGDLSGAQATEISSAASASPESELELLRAAASEGPAGLKQLCGRVRAAAEGEEVARHEAIHRSRHLRHWTSHDGAFRLDGRFTPEAGAVVLAALRPYQERIFRDAREAGRREPHEAYAADALVALAEEGRSDANAMVQVRVDAAALARGHLEAGEVCEIDGVGPVPVATASALLSDAVVSAVVSDGVDITTVAHLGRTIPAHLRTALQARDPTCVVPGCSVADHLDIDHIVPFAQGGPTRLDNLARLCRFHHHQKTYRGYRLEGGPGHWRWVTPDDSPGTPESPTLSFSPP